MYGNYLQVGYDVVLGVLLFSVVVPWIAMIYKPAALPFKLAGGLALGRAVLTFLAPIFYAQLGLSFAILASVIYIGTWISIAVAVGMIVLNVKAEADARETH